MALIVPRDRDLSDLLSHASSADLDVLADLITDNGKGRMALDSSIKAVILKRKEQGMLQSIADVLESEICAFGGNSFRNLVRSKGVDYRELAVDVAEHLGGKPDGCKDLFAIEDIIIQQAVAKFDASGAQGKASSDGLFDKLDGIVRSLIADSGTLLGVMAAGGAAGLAGTVGGRLKAALIPALTVVAGAGAIVQAAAPAFRITVPAAIQVAKIRRVRFEADFTAYSEALKACL